MIIILLENLLQKERYKKNIEGVLFVVVVVALG